MASSFEDRIAEAARKIKKKQERESRKLKKSYDHPGPKTDKSEKSKLLDEMNTQYGISNSTMAAEVYYKALEMGEEKLTSMRLSEVLDEPVDSVIDALYQLSDIGLVIPPGGLETSYKFIKKDNSAKLLDKLAEKNDRSKFSKLKRSKSKDNKPADPEEASLFDTLKNSEKRESKGMLSIASNIVDPKDAVKAHEMMDTDDQMKAFMVQHARYELTRVVKLENALSKIEDKYVDNALGNLDNLAQDTLEETMSTINDALGRAGDIIDKYFGDPELKLFVEDMTLNSEDSKSKSLDTIAQSQESREKIRVVSSKFLKLIDNNPSEIINAKPVEAEEATPTDNNDDKGVDDKNEETGDIPK